MNDTAPNQPWRLDAPPAVMGVINASADSFSGSSVEPGDALALAQRLLDDGADILDIGAQSLRTDQDEIPPEVEVGRLEPVLAALREGLPASTVISVDTYRYEPARLAVESGATIINDPSGLMDPRMPELIAESGARLVVTFNRARPKQRLAPGDLSTDVVGDCLRFLESCLPRLLDAGVELSQVVFDPGVDLGKSPSQTVEVLRAMPRIRRESGVDGVLWALSRKDFVGAILERRPAGRAAGTLAALAACDLRPADMVRVHDVRATADFFRIASALVHGIPAATDLPPDLRFDVPRD